MYDGSEFGRKISSAHVNVYKQSEEQDLGKEKKYIYLCKGADNSPQSPTVYCIEVRNPK